MIEALPVPVLDEFGLPPAEPPPTPFETVDALSAFVPVLRDDDGLLDVALAAYRHLGFAQAALLRALAELHARFEADSPRPPLGREPLLDVAGEFSPAAAVAPGTANNLVDLAIRLVGTLPRTLEALEKGRTDLTKAKVVAEVTAALDVRARRRVEDLGLAQAATKTPRQLRRLLTAEAIAADPAAAETRHQAARQRRRAESYPDPDGMATLVFHGPAEQCARVFDVIDHAARCGYPDADQRTLDQRRFDALHDLVTGTMQGPKGERASGVGELQVVIAASTLIGLNQAGPAQGVRPDHRGRCTRLRRGRTVAPARHRRHGRLAAGRRHPLLPPTPAPRTIHQDPGPDVHRALLRPRRPHLPDRPHPELPRRPHRRGQPRRPLPDRPQPENPRVGISRPDRTRRLPVSTTRLGRTYEVDHKPYLPFTDNELTGDDEPPPF